MFTSKNVMIELIEGGYYMKKLQQGTFEIFTSKTDAISKLIQLQGICKDIKNSNDCRIMFHCDKRGKITVESLRDRYNLKKAKMLTKLHGDIFEQGNKTYINYCVFLDKKSVFLRLCVFLIAIVILSIFSVFIADKIKVLIAVIICIIGLVFQLISINKEKENPSLNSKILIKVLENKINIINNWGK